MPGHKKIFDFLHGQNLPVILHSCGFITPLLPSLIETGIDCLQAMEVKAGMDPLKLKKCYGNEISFCGGLDARNLATNDIDAIRIELDEKIPVMKENYGYILHSDHSIPATCEYETYTFFKDAGLKLGTY